MVSAVLVFQEHARAILRQIDKSLQELNGEPGELHGTLRPLDRSESRLEEGRMRLLGPLKTPL
jgi:hypothetical protein